MKYMTIVADNPRDLDANVNALLKEGWELWGGVAVAQCLAPEWSEEDAEYVDAVDAGLGNGDGEEDDDEEPHPAIFMTYAQALVKRD